MPRAKETHNAFLLVLLSAAAWVTFLMIRPYIGSLLFALAFAIIFQPAHQKILRLTRYRESLAALISVLCILILVVAPLFFVSLQIFAEAQNLYHTLSDTHNHIFTLTGNGVQNSIEHVAPGIVINFNELTQKSLAWLSQNLDSLFSSLVGTFINLLLTLIALFYFLRDGSRSTRWLSHISPLSNNEDAEIFEKLEATIRSVFRKSIVVGIIQGVMMSIGFLIFRVPNPTLFGAAAAVTSLVPFVGTFLVIVPACTFLLLKGSLFAAVGLALWGSIITVFAENFLSPAILQKGINIHSLLILVSIIGGLSLFGPIGFLLGPLVLSFFAVLLNIYLMRIGKVL